MLLETMGWDVARYTDGRDFLERDTLEGPGCIVLDVRMPGLTGLMAVHALHHGAVDFMEKPVDPMVFVQKVSRAVAASVDEHVREREENERRNRFETLTPREKDVVHAVLEGKANKVIARDLGLEVSTIKMHRANAFAKLGVHSPAELTRLAFESGYADAKTTLP